MFFTMKSITISTSLLFTVLTFSICNDCSAITVSVPKDHPFEQKYNCTDEMLGAASKCKCALMARFLPFNDGRLQYCRKSMGVKKLYMLRPYCNQFYSGATSYKALTAMYAIEKMGGYCFPEDCRSAASSAYEPGWFPSDLPRGPRATPSPTAFPGGTPIDPSIDGIPSTLRKNPHSYRMNHKVKLAIKHVFNL